MSEQVFKQNDMVWYQGLQWVVVNTVDGVVNLIRQDGELGPNVRAKAKAALLSRYVPMNEREEPPDDDEYPLT